MRVPLTLLFTLFLMSGCGRQSRYLPQPGLREKIEFSYAPSFAPRWIVHLERDSRGLVTGKVFRSASDDFSGREQRKSFTAAPEIFDRIVALIESADLKEAAERYPMIGTDGFGFEFTRRMGNRRLSYSIWGPARDNPHTKLAIDLADLFLRAVDIESITELQKTPNQSSEPTPTSVTICAEPQIAPAAVAAHL